MKCSLTITGCCAAALTVFSLTVEAASKSGKTPCADPAANIELALISKSGPTTGRVRVTGVVKNLGKAAWTATSPAHYLQMVLARREAGAQPEGEPVQPAIAIRQLAPGQQYRIDYQTDWDTDKKGSYPRFIVRFADAGEVGSGPASRRQDCRAGNNRKEITAADINRLFQRPVSAKPLEAQSYRLLGGIGVNTVETELTYRRSSAIAGKLTASVAAPYAGTADDVPISGNSGTEKIRVHIPCDAKQTSVPHPPPVRITYRLRDSPAVPGKSGGAPSISVEQSIPYRELCDPVVVDKTNL